MNGEVQNFIERIVNDYPIHGRVLEIGSRDICGSARRWFTKDGQQKEPTDRFPEYIGIDQAKGNLVDIVMNAHRLTASFGYRSFDIVITTSQLEHDDDPFITLWEIQGVLKVGGYLILTVPSWRNEGPHDRVDYWRFMPDGVRVMVERPGLKIIELIDHEPSNDVMCLARRET